MTETDQRTLDGEVADVEYVECEIYPVCSRSAEWEVETLVYDGTAQVYQELPACDSCAREITEPDAPSESHLARQLGRTERIVTRGNRDGGERGAEG